MMKKLMILGAGIYQVPLIQQAKKMGLYTIVVSYPGDYPGFALADQVCLLDTRDQERVMEAAQKEKIDGICTSGTDVAVRTIGYVCEHMGLHGLSYEAARCVTDKLLMKEAFARHDVSTPQFVKVADLDQARQAALRLGYPLVVKAVDSSGSRGVVIVQEPGQLSAAFSEAMQVSQKGYVLAEEYIQAEEIGVDGFVKEGRLVFFAPHEKYLFRAAQAAVPAGHSFPYLCADGRLEEIRRQMQRAVDATGLDGCPVNADVLVDREKVWIIEIGGRTGATCIPELISLYYGSSFYEKMILNALGEEVQFGGSSSVPCKGRLLMSPVDGTITRIAEEKLDGLRRQGIEVVLDFSVGQRVQAMKNGTDRIGHVIARAETEDEFLAIYRQVQSCIWINGEELSQLEDGKG